VISNAKADEFATLKFKEVIAEERPLEKKMRVLKDLILLMERF